MPALENMGSLGLLKWLHDHRFPTAWTPRGGIVCVGGWCIRWTEPNMPVEVELDGRPVADIVTAEELLEAMQK